MSDIKTRVLLPKGEALEACTAACQENLGIEIPDFEGRKLSAETGEVDVFWLKPRDIPGLIAKGLGDVGFAGTDSVQEYGDPRAISSFRVSDEAMCRFSLLALGEEGKESLDRLFNADARRAGLVEVPTGLPRLLSFAASSGDLPVMPYEGDFCPSGSIEAYAKLTGSIGVADLVQTGSTAKANGLIEFQQLCNIYPEQVERRQA